MRLSYPIIFLYICRGCLVVVCCACPHCICKQKLNLKKKQLHFKKKNIKESFYREKRAKPSRRGPRTKQILLPCSATAVGLWVPPRSVPTAIRPGTATKSARRLTGSWFTRKSVASQAWQIPLPASLIWQIFKGL